MSARKHLFSKHVKLAKAKSKMQQLDELVRTRLRMGIGKQWKLPKARLWHLTKLGIKPNKAYEWGNSSKGFCRVAQPYITVV